MNRCKKAAGLYLSPLAMFVLFWLAACAASPVPLPTKISLVPTLTPSPSATPLLPTAPITPTLTPRPTKRPTSEPTPTPEPTPCNRPGHLAAETFSSATAGPVGYRIYLPPCYGLDGRTYPTLYMLPGNTHTESIWDELGLDEAAEAAILAGLLPPPIIVMADGGWIANNSSGGPGSYETVILAELIPFIENNYCVWAEADGRALGGLSRGGYWALEIAFRHPEQFVSVGGHSAALYDIAAGPALNPEYTGINNDLGDLRIYFDIGAEDYLIAPIRRLHQAMETAGIAHTWVLNSGQHENAYWSAHVGDYLAWYTIPWSFERDSYPLC